MYLGVKISAKSLLRGAKMNARDEHLTSFIQGYGHVFLIPPFQRNYEWNKDQCEELFYDLMNLYNNPGFTHYFGNIVFYMGQVTPCFSEFILVDGQQRMTSILLLICAMRDLLGNENRKIEINRIYLKNDLIYNPPSSVRIRQTSHDRIVFERIINGEPIQGDDQRNNIYVNYNVFLNLLRENNLVSDDSINSLFNALTRVLVVSVNLETGNNLAEVQTIFEKINSTGKPLSQADLIRNYLLISDNMDTQEWLYNDYWKVLEDTVGSENIEPFTKCYLTIKSMESFEDDKLYLSFKRYFDDEECSKGDILREMKKISKYYKWLNKACSENDDINYYIQEFNALRARDMYSLYIVLFDRLYGNRTDCLIDIFKVLSDFLIRFRIAGNAHGGAALRKIVLDLLRVIQNNDLDLTAERIRFELSRYYGERKFPTDEEFVRALKSSNKTNHTYGKVVLRRIEDNNGYFNIKIPLESITVEHFMPQTRTNWWQQNLGGVENANRIYEMYINCIGNLGIMSGPLNAHISNRPWPDKLESIRNVQFNVTRVNSVSWTEREIIDRNEDLTTKAKKCIAGPVVVGQEVIVNDENGVYPASDVVTNLTGSEVDAYIFDNVQTACENWQSIWSFVVRKAYQSNTERFSDMVLRNVVHKSKRVPGTNEYKPIFVSSADRQGELNTPGRLEDTDYYYEKKLSSERIRKYTYEVLNYFEMLDRLSYVVRFSD